MNLLFVRSPLCKAITTAMFGLLAACESVPVAGPAAQAADPSSEPPTSDAARAALTPPPSIRGALLPDNGGFQLLPCRAAGSWEVIDRTDGRLAAAYGELAAAGEALYVELATDPASARAIAEHVKARTRSKRKVTTDATGLIGVAGVGPAAAAQLETAPSDDDDRLVATGIVRATPVAVNFECKRAGEPLLAMASGNEPFWSLTVTPEAITLLDVAGEAELRFPSAPPEATFGGFAFRSSAADPLISRRTGVNDGPGDVRLVATFRARRCTDSMSGAWSSYAVTVSMGDKTFHGCGHTGRLFGPAE